MHHFDFGYLYNFTHDPTTPEHFIRTPYQNQSILTLTYDGCINAVCDGWVTYGRQDMYDRILLWRMPLFSLWLTTVLPTFGIWSMIFTLVHLISDPIDTIWSMLYKLDLTLRIVRWTNKPDNRSSFTNFRNETDESGSGGGERRGERMRRIPPPTDTETQRLIERAPEGDAHSKAFQSVCAVIISAYEEWGFGDEAREAMKFFFNKDRWRMFSQRRTLKVKCEQTAFFIASDRVARLLPTVATSVTFLLHLTAGFWKTLTTVGDRYDEQNPVSAGLTRAPHNIAFGVLFFWIPFVVLMTAVIGGSQTSQVVPRVLENLKKKSDRQQAKDSRSNVQHPPESSATAEEPPADEVPTTPAVEAPVGNESVESVTEEGTAADPPAEATPDESESRSRSEDIPVKPPAHASTELSPPGKDERPSFPKIDSDTNRSGGMPVWQLNKFKDFGSSSGHCTFARTALCLSIAIVAIPTACAIAICWLTPTEGFGCRIMTQLAFFLMWVFNVFLDFLLYHFAQDGNGKPRATIIFWITLCKDILIVVGTITTLAFSAKGVYNSCSCWCKWRNSRGYISFPQDDYVFHLIRHWLAKVFPWIVGVAFGIQFFLFCILVYFWQALNVLKQRDLRENSSWIKRHWGKLERWICCKPR